WPSNLYASLPLSTSQTRTPPFPPETTRLPSGENAAQQAAPLPSMSASLWESARNVCSTLPDFTSQMTTLPSQPDDRRRSPSGEKQTLVTKLVSPPNSLRTSLPVSRSHRRIRVQVYVAGRRRHALASQRQRRADDAVGVSGEDAQLLAGIGVPQPQRAVVDASGQQAFAVGRDADAIPAVLVDGAVR